MAIHLNESNFASYTADGQKAMLVDFWAGWCGPCRMLAPVLEEVEKEVSGILIGKVNVDEELALASRFGISSIPTLLLFKEGKPVAQSVGYQSKQQVLSWLKTQGVLHEEIQTER